MAQTSSVTTSKLSGILAAETGLVLGIAQVSAREGEALEPFGIEQLATQNVAPELADKSLSGRYPLFLVYCERLTNTQREKFRTFSGKARLTVEVRTSQDRLDGMQRQLELYVDAVTNTLDNHRGGWGGGVFYSGGYEVSFGAAKHGGKNFLQIAKVTLEVEVSQN